MLVLYNSIHHSRAVELKACVSLEKVRAGNKPGSVLTDVSRDHLSRMAVTGRLQRPTRPPGGPPDSGSIWTCNWWGLHCQSCHQDCGRLLPCHFTLTCVSGETIGGMFSVALSIGSRRLAVSQHPCPMLPGLSSSSPDSKIIRKAGGHVSGSDAY